MPSIIQKPADKNVGDTAARNGCATLRLEPAHSGATDVNIALLRYLDAARLADNGDPDLAWVLQLILDARSQVSR